MTPAELAAVIEGIERGVLSLRAVKANTALPAYVRTDAAEAYDKLMRAGELLTTAANEYIATKQKEGR